MAQRRIQELEAQLAETQDRWAAEVGNRKNNETALSQANQKLEAGRADRAQDLETHHRKLNASIEERRRAENDLLQQNREFQMLLDLCPVGIAWSRDPECHWVIANPALAEILGVPVGENCSCSPAEGQPLPGYRCFRKGRPMHPEDFPMRRAAAGQEVRGDEIEIIRPDGTFFTLCAFATALIGACGERRGALGIFVAITDRRRMEEELRLARQDLSRRIEERTSELAATNQALSFEIVERRQTEEQLRLENVERRQIEENLRQSKDLMRRQAEKLLEADRRKDEFLAMLAHELRNPLSPIRTTLELLRMHPMHADGRVEKWLELMNRQVDHLTHIVDDLLDTSRISRGVIVLQKQTVWLGSLIEQAVEANRLLFASQGQTFSVDAAPDELAVTADPVRLMQILSNLLHNASKYTPSGGSVALILRAEDDQAVIEVRDNGIGIAADVLPRIFDLFYQADRSLDRRMGGLGVGLTLVRQLAELHGGTVQAFSDGPGAGSRFVLRLPLDSPAGPAPAVSQEFRPLGSERQLKVLVIEDNVDAAESLGEVLSHWGYRHWLCHDGLEALQQAGAIRPDAVLVDIGLPGIDGFEVCRRLRENPDLGKLRLAALTGYGPQRENPRGHLFDAYFTKPVDLDKLNQFLVETPTA